MIRRWLITLALVIAVPLLTAAVHFRPRTVPLNECSELYRRYADNPDIRAAYVSNYRVNDTLTLCATLLEAANDTGWIVLRKISGMKIQNEPDSVISLIKSENPLTLIFNNKENPYFGMNDVAVASITDRYVCVFHTENETQKGVILDAIIDLIYNSLKTNKKINQNEKIN